MFFSFPAVLLFTATVLAQTPPGFIPNVTSKLFNSFDHITPGKAITKDETTHVPHSLATYPPLNGTYIFIMVDLDVPGSLVGGPPGTRVTNLHCLLTGYKSNTGPSKGLWFMRRHDTTPKPYIRPDPPAENPPYAHRYVELLYPQPDDFEVPASQISAINRGIGFNLTAFAMEAVLASPLKANWFTVTA